MNIKPKPIYPYTLLGGETLFYPLDIDTKNYSTGLGVSDATYTNSSSNSNFQITSNSFYGKGALVKTTANGLAGGAGTDGLLLKSVNIYNQSYSISFWYYATSGFGFLFSLLGTGAFSGASYNGALPSNRGGIIGTTNTTMYLVGSNSTTGADVNSSSYSFFTVNQWNHFVWTVNYISSNNATSTVYINNGTGITLSSSCFYSNYLGASDPVKTFLFFQPFVPDVSGKIANYRLFVGTVLSAANIANLYTNKL